MNRSVLFVLMLLFTFESVSFSQELINIDAEKDDFFKGLTGPDDGFIVLPKESFNVYAKAEPDSLDLSAQVWMAYDDVYLYTYAEVVDDSLILNYPNRPWRNDCFEFKIDPDPTQMATEDIYPCRMTALDSADADFSVPDVLTGVDNLNAETYFPGGQLGDYARKKIPGGYVVEFRLSLEDLRVDDRMLLVYPPIPGIQIGLAITIYDWDVKYGEDSSGNVQFSTVLHNEVFKNPHYLGTLEFLEGNKVKLIACNAITNECLENWEIMYTPKIPVSVCCDTRETIPTRYVLSQNFPNPFNPSTTISYSILKAGIIKLSIYDILGKEIQTLVKEYQSADTYTVKFDVSDLSGGVYFYRLQAGNDFVDTKKMLLLR